MISSARAASIHYQLLLVLAMLIPSGFYKLGGVVIALLAVNGLFGLKGYRKLNQMDLPILFCVAFFVVILLGLLYADNFSNQLQYVSRKVSFILIPLAFLGYSLTSHQLLSIKRYFVFSTLLFVLIADGYALFDYLKTGELQVFLSQSWHNKFTYYGLTRVFSKWHPTYVSLFLNLTLVFVYQLYFKIKKFKSWFIISSLAVLNIFLLSSFIGIVSFVFLLLLFVYQWFKDKKALLTINLIALMSLVTVFYIYNPLHYSKIDQFKQKEIKVTDKKEERNVLNLRLAKWKTSLQVFSSAPVFGVSNGDYKDALYSKYIENDFMFCAKKRYSSHNQYLYTATSNGLVGLLVLISLFVLPLLYRLGEKTLFPFLGIMSIYFLTEDVLARQQGMVFFIFFYILVTRNLAPSITSANEQ